MKDRRRCITACWLNDCIGQRRMTPPQKVVHLPSFYGDAKPVQSKVPIDLFYQLINNKIQLFAIHGFEESERSYLKMMIKAIGGTCTNYLSKAHDFVVAKSYVLPSPHLILPWFSGPTATKLARPTHGTFRSSTCSGWRSCRSAARRCWTRSITRW